MDAGAERRLIRAATHERLIVYALMASAIAAILIGGALAKRRHNHELMNRAGAAVVALQGTAGLVEYSRRRRIRAAMRMLREREESGRDPGLELFETELARYEFRILVIVITLATIGEVLHGFGDIIAEALFGPH